LPELLERERAVQQQRSGAAVALIYSLHCPELAATTPGRS